MSISRDDYCVARLGTLMMIDVLRKPSMYAQVPEAIRQAVKQQVLQEQRQKLAELRHVYYRGLEDEG